jgi:excisionase family DNA binding protein
MNACAAAGTFPVIRDVPGHRGNQMTNTRLAYSIPDACELLSVGRTTLYSAIKKGDLKTCKAGRRTLVTAEALHLWIEGLPNSRQPLSIAHDTGGSNE